MRRTHFGDITCMTAFWFATRFFDSGENKFHEGGMSVSEDAAFRVGSEIACRTTLIVAHVVRSPSNHFFFPAESRFVRV